MPARQSEAPDLSGVSSVSIFQESLATLRYLKLLAAFCHFSANIPPETHVKLRHLNLDIFSLTQKPDFMLFVPLWYSGEHSCLPSRRPRFDSWLSQTTPIFCLPPVFSSSFIQPENRAASCSSLRLIWNVSLPQYNSVCRRVNGFTTIQYKVQYKWRFQIVDTSWYLSCLSLSRDIIVLKEFFLTWSCMTVLTVIG